MGTIIVMLIALVSFLIYISIGMTLAIIVIRLGHLLFDRDIYFGFYVPEVLVSVTFSLFWPVLTPFVILFAIWAIVAAVFIAARECIDRNRVMRNIKRGY